MDIGVISVRYARALLKTSLELKVDKLVYTDMQILAQSFLQLPELNRAMENPMLQKEQKLHLLTVALGEEADELSKKFICLVLDARREGILQFMAHSYLTLYRRHKNIIRGQLTTAVTVSSSVKLKMKQLIESRTQGKVEFNSSVDPSLLGGFVLEYDTYKMDASIKTKLNTIQLQLD